MERAGPPVLDELQRSKPGPGVGRIEASVVRRPAPDEAVIEAHWWRGPVGVSCALDLVLPEAVELVEGERSVVLAPAAESGRATWTVRFPYGRTLDAVIRLCAESAEGTRSTEVALRLVDAPE